MSKSSPRLIFLFLEVPWVASLNRKRLVVPIRCGQLKVWNTISPDLVRGNQAGGAAGVDCPLGRQTETVAVCLGLLEISGQQ